MFFWMHVMYIDLITCHNVLETCCNSFQCRRLRFFATEHTFDWCFGWLFCFLTDWCLSFAVVCCSLFVRFMFETDLSVLYVQSKFQVIMNITPARWKRNGPCNLGGRESANSPRNRRGRPPGWIKFSKESLEPFVFSRQKTHKLILYHVRIIQYMYIHDGVLRLYRWRMKALHDSFRNFTDLGLLQHGQHGEEMTWHWNCTQAQHWMNYTSAVFKTNQQPHREPTEEEAKDACLRFCFRRILFFFRGI